MNSLIQRRKTKENIYNSFRLIRKSYALYPESLAWIRKKNYLYSAKGMRYIAKDLCLFKKVLFWFEKLPCKLRVNSQKSHVYSRTNELKLLNAAPKLSWIVFCYKSFLTTFVKKKFQFEVEERNYNLHTKLLLTIALIIKWSLES